MVSVVDRDNRPAHTLTAGEKVYVQAIQGCQEAVGFHKVAAFPAPTASAFALLNDDNSPVTCGVPFDTSFESGWVGKYHAVTLRSASAADVSRFWRYT